MKSLSDCSVLVVDDATENLMIISGILEGFCKVTTVSTGLEALARANECPPDLILLDVLMPGMDGFATCRRLKENPGTSSTPVIFLTSLTEPEDKIVGFEAGAVDFISRPFDAAEVRSRVSTHLRLHLLEEDQKTRIGRLAEALETSEETYRFFAEHTDDILLQLDAACRISMVNRGWKGLTGKDRGVVLGRSLHEICAAEDSPRIEKALLLATGEAKESLRIEFRLETKTGKRWMRAALRLRFDDSGKLSGVTGIVSDIHDLIARTQELQASREASAEAVALQISRLQETAHRFRTPLQDIAGSLSLLLGLPLDPPAREFAESAEEGCRALNAVFDEMLDEIRREPPGISPPPHPLDLPPFQPDPSRNFDCRVLVADDSPINLRILEHLVRRMGFQTVDAVESGEAALDLYNRHHHPLVLLDCQMPLPDGYDVCAEIRKLPESAPSILIAVSACALPENFSRCLKAGFDHQLEKPVTIDSLRNLLAGFGWATQE